MPMYDYECPSCTAQFEYIRPIAERHWAPCLCGADARMVIRNTPRIDPNADLPGARMLQRKKMEERGRGRDMWSGNREVADEGILRDAHAHRKARGETSVTVGGKKKEG